MKCGDYPYKSMKDKKTANDWLKDLLDDKHITGKPDDVPEGWLTLTQMSAKYSLPITTLNSQMTKLVNLGKIQRKKFRVDTGRQLALVYHYNKA